MKKILTSALLFLVLIISAIAPVSASVATDEGYNNADVLNWNIFTKSKAILEQNGAGKRLDCDMTSTQSLINQSATDQEGYEAAIEGYKATDPGYVRDVKGCLMQEKVDTFLIWSIYLVIIGLVIYILYTIAIIFLGGGGKDSGANDMMSPTGGGGDNNEIASKIKSPLIAAVILFLIALGTINILLELVAWLKDAIIG